MKDLRGRFLWCYAVLMLMVTAGFVRWNAYNMDGDGTAFLNISEYLNSGNVHMAVNAYWNPGYAAVLAIGRRIAHADTWTELAAARWTNWFIFMGAIAATVFFTSGLARLRQAHKEATPIIPSNALHLLGLGLLLMSTGRELPLEAVRSDTLLYTLLLTAMGIFLRIQADAGWWTYPALGMTLGTAYLTKSFALTPSLLLLIVLFIMAVRRKDSLRTRHAVGVVTSALLFALIAGPYILAISRQMGHFTPGESARLNYAFFIDEMPRWHEWHQHNLGHATGTFIHAETVIGENPPVYSFAAHPYGTFPLWFDPAYWTAGVKTTIYIKGQLIRLERCSELFVRFVLARPEPLLLIVVLLCLGGRLPSIRRSRFWMAPMLWGILMFAIYFLVDLQDRYLTAPYLLIVLAVLASLHTGGTDDTARLQFLGKGCAVLLAGVIFVQALTVALETRRQLPASARSLPGYSPQITQAAIGLRNLGIKPGDKLACMGDVTCYTDHYWARIPGAQILAEVQTPNSREPLEEWNSIADPARVTAPLKAMGLRAIVTKFPNSASKPAGWVQLGTSDYFAYPLTQ